MVGKGVYDETTLVIPKNYTYIKGRFDYQGHSPSIQSTYITVNSAAGGKFIDIYQKSFNKIEDLSIDLISTSISPTPTHAIFIDGLNGESGNNIIKGCYIKDAKNDAITVTRSDYNIIENNIIGPILRNPNYMLTISNSITIEGKNNGSSFISADYNQVLHNITYENNTHYGVNLISLTENNEDYNFGNIIGGNRIEKAWDGIYLVNQKDFEVYNNIIVESTGWNETGSAINESNEGFGINILNRHEFNYDCSGKIYNNTLINSYNIGIYSQHCWGFEIINNLFRNNGWPGTSQNSYHQIKINLPHNSGFTFNSNIYYNEPGGNPLRWSFSDHTSTTLEDWSNWSGEENGLDDEIVLDSKFRPFDGPCIETGVALGTGYYQYDIGGVYRSSGGNESWSRGAYELPSEEEGLALIDAEITSPTTVELSFNSPIGNSGQINTSNFLIDDLEIDSVCLIGNDKIEVTTSEQENFKNYVVILNNLENSQGNGLIPIFRSQIYSSEGLGKKRTNKEIYPMLFSLEQNYPNPFNPITTIKYSIPKAGVVSIKIYDILGSEVTTVVNEFKDAGTFEVKFNANDLASGVYFYQLNAGNNISTKKMLLLK